MKADGVDPAPGRENVDGLAYPNSSLVLGRGCRELFVLKPVSSGDDPEVSLSTEPCKCAGNHKAFTKIV